MSDNPYCRCGRHLGMPWHTTSEHKYAVEEESEENEARIVGPKTAENIAVWAGGRALVEHDAVDYSKTYSAVNVPTNRGVRRAAEGDYVIKQEDGSFEVMGPTDYLDTLG